VDVARGFHALPSGVQREVRSQATRLHASIRATAADLSEPTLINEDDPRIDPSWMLSIIRHVPFSGTLVNV